MNITSIYTNEHGDWRQSTTITVEEAGRILGVGRSAAYAAARSGDLPGVIRIGRKLRVSVSALRHLLGEE